jgi:asparagine synthase (glutamine-hydrolysing)
MCGFLCLMTRRPLNEAVDITGFNKDILRHRGPDSSGELRFPHAFVRHWRLSIVDLAETSSQPYGGGDTWLIYNGEIYDYEEIAGRLGLQVTGDTPLVYALCRKGIEREELPRASGFYSYLYLSDDGLSLSGARDPFGKKPLFYHVDDAAGIAVFASEERAIVDCLGARAVDFGAISQYLLYKQVFHGGTCLADIKQLAPGAGFHFDVRRWRFDVDRGWGDYYEMPAADVFSIAPEGDAGSDGALESQVYAGLRECLVRRVPRDVQASVALSGGIDSSLIARLAVETSSLHHISRFVTVGFDEASADESSRAAAIAAELGVGEKHSVARFPEKEMLACLRWCIERASSPLEHPHYLSYSVLCRYASGFAKVLITGEGADELFMGYDHYRTPGTSFAFREYLLEEDERHFISGSSADRPFDAIRRAAAVDGLRARALASRAGSREYELKTHLLTLLARNDKMGMAHSVEIRAPFLDRHMMQLALAVPESELVVAGSVKHVLKRMFSNRFPAIGLLERKMGFRVPFDEMFAAGRGRGDIRGYLETAARALDRECGLRLTALETIAPRLGWSLVNIGLFLETQGYAA